MTKNFPGIFFWDSNQGKNKPATLNRSQNFFRNFIFRGPPTQTTKNFPEILFKELLPPMCVKNRRGGAGVT